MMGDLKKRASFARVVNYVNNPKKARLIDSKDVRLDDNTSIARSMQGQADDKPGRKLKNPVYHISLDFAHEDAPKLTDALMVEIAREYMRRMGIVNTQYIVSRHTDREHQHLHIVANRVDNDGKTVSDSNDDVRNVKVCKALTREYGLHFSKGKMNVKRDRLRGKDKVKYQIYDAIKAALPHCNCWSDLCDRLAKQGIGANFKYNRNEGKIIGVSFTKDEISFSGSRIDRSMSFYKLDRLFGSRIVEGMEWKPRDAVPVHPRDARMGDVSGHHGLAARHGLYLHDAESLRLLHAAQAEDVAGPVIGGQLPVGDPAEQPHPVLHAPGLDFSPQLAHQRAGAAYQHHIVVGQVAGGLYQVAVALVGHQAP